MRTYTYPLFFKLLYRWGNIPITLLFLIYLIPSVLNVDRNLIYLIPIVLLLLFIYFVNKRYLYIYKIIPYKIISDNEKLQCTDFLFSEKEIVIYYSDISALQGGIFDGKLTGLMKVYDGRNKIHIGFYPKLRDVNKLQTAILSRVDKLVYEEVINKIGANKTTRQK